MTKSTKVGTLLSEFNNMSCGEQGKFLNLILNKTAHKSNEFFRKVKVKDHRVRTTWQSFQIIGLDESQIQNRLFRYAHQFVLLGTLYLEKFCRIVNALHKSQSQVYQIDVHERFKKIYHATPPYKFNYKRGLHYFNNKTLSGENMVIIESIVNNMVYISFKNQKENYKW